MVVASCSDTMPVAWSISARCRARSGGWPPGPPAAAGAFPSACWLSSRITAAVSAKIRASPNSGLVSGPGLSRYRPRDPTRMAPISNGSAKIAAASAWRACGVNPGQRRVASASSRSEISTGDHDVRTSRHGPSPRVICSSASCSLLSPVTHIRCAPAAPGTVTQAPVTGSAATAAVHTSTADTCSRRAAARSATRPQISAERPDITGRADRIGADRHAHRAPAGKPAHPLAAPAGRLKNHRTGPGPDRCRQSW
jgi:hypothetical protein